MNKLNKIAFLGIVIVIFSATQIFVFQPNIAYACTCVGISQEESFDKAKAVFSGRVLSIDNKDGLSDKIIGSFEPPFSSRREVKIQVLESWKGIDSDIVTVATGKGGGDCGFTFWEGEEYLIYAYDASKYFKTELGTGICNRTQTLFAAWEEVLSLGKGTEFPAKREVSIVEQSTDNKTWYILFTIPLLTALLFFFIRRPLKRFIKQHVKKND